MAGFARTVEETCHIWLGRGLRRAELGVEERNPRARALYERLGYAAYDRRKELS